MKRKIRKSTGFADHLTSQLARDVQRGFDAILDETLHKVTIVWNAPIVLAVPFFGGEPRLSSPALVRCDRAVNLTNSQILVTPGGVAWEWVGRNQVRIDAVDGLAPGSEYDLVFTVVG